MKRPSKVKEAFLEGFNQVGLAGAAAASFALLNPLPFIGALVIEAAYLLFVPDSKWYERRLASKYDQEVIERRKKLRDQVFPSLNSNMQARFTRLESTRDQIGSQTFDGRLIFREVLRKLDYLLEKFLLFSSKEVQFENYLRSVADEVQHGPVVPPPVQKRPNKRIVFQIEDMTERDEWIKDTVALISGKYKDEITGIDDLLQKDENLHNQAVLDKRKEVLTRRSQYVDRIGEIAGLTAAARRLLDKLPAELKSDPDAQKLAAACDERSWMIVRLINRRPSHFGAVKDYEFSRTTIEEAWAAGLEDVRRSVAGWDQVEPAQVGQGVLLYRPTEVLPPAAAEPSAPPESMRRQ